MPESDAQAGNTKICSYCAETIQAAAIICRFCGRDVPVTTSPLGESSLSITGPPRTVAESPEVIYLQNSDATVTSSRVLISGKTYALANVTSVVLATQPPDTAAATGCGCFGALAGLSALGSGALFSDRGFEFFGVVLAVGAVIGAIQVAKTKKTKYFVRLGSASGESNTLWAYDKAYIQTIVSAINEAIVKRG